MKESTATRIYLVTEPDGTEHFVRAKGKSTARAFVVNPAYTVAVANADDILGRRELQVEDATQYSDGEPTTAPNTK